MTVKPNVWRWAGPLYDALYSVGYRGLELAQALTAGLAQIDHESAGNASARNTSSGAWGLTQQLPGYYRAQWARAQGERNNVLHHLALYAANIRRIEQASGSLVSAVASHAHGEGATKYIVTNGRPHPDHHWVPQQIRGYIDPLWRRSFAVYGRAVASWYEAGRPRVEGEITVNGYAQRVSWAAPVNSSTPGPPNPYRGVYHWGGRSHRVAPEAGIVGDNNVATFNPLRRAAEGVALLAVGAVAARIAWGVATARGWV